MAGSDRIHVASAAIAGVCRKKRGTRSLRSRGSAGRSSRSVCGGTWPRGVSTAQRRRRARRRRGGVRECACLHRREPHVVLLDVGQRGPIAREYDLLHEAGVGQARELRQRHRQRALEHGSGRR
eukprot:969653-Prymnesium_polylepis.1